MDEPVEVEDFKETTNHFRWIYGIYPKFIEKKTKDGNVYISLSKSLIMLCGTDNIMRKYSTIHVEYEE